MTKKQTNHSASRTPEELQKNRFANETEILRNLKTEAENFYYSGSNVLKNKHGIKDLGTFKKQYTQDIEKAMVTLRQEPLPKRFDFTYLQHIHHSLFKETFEWAGQSREFSFTFADGSTASAPFIKEKELKKPFAIGREIGRKLNELDKMLAEKNNLKDLNREEFVEHATKVMVDLHHAYPFREGNRQAIQFFIEKLAEAAGHKLNFELVTKKRKDFVRAEAINNGNSEPMKHLLEDISNPQKLLVLKEFTHEMQNLGLKEENYRLAVVAQDSHTYQGTFRGCGYHGFMMDMNGTYILGDRKDLSAKQLETLKIGDRFSFTAPLSQELQKVLIPQKTIAPLSQNELSERIQSTESVQACKENIEALCKTVYGKRHILREKLREITENPTDGETLGYQIIESPKSISRLAGFKICGIKNRTRVRAEDTLLSLSLAIDHYVNTVKEAKEEILHSHSAQQKRCAQLVEMPNEQLKNLFSLSKEQQEKALSTSPELRTQIKAYSQKLNERLSSSEHEAVAERNYKKLSESLDSSINQAEQIVKILQQTKEINESLLKYSFHYHEPSKHTAQNIRQPVQETDPLNRAFFLYREIDKQTKHQRHLFVTKSRSEEFMKANTSAKKMIKSTTQEKEIKQQHQSHKVERLKAMTI